MDQRWSCHRCSGRRHFVFIAQRQNVFLQVCDPLLLNRQRSMKYFLTEPEQQDREVLLTASYEAEKEPPPTKTNIDINSVYTHWPLHSRHLYITMSTWSTQPAEVEVWHVCCSTSTNSIYAENIQWAARDQRKMARLLWADEKATVTHCIWTSPNAQHV